MKPSLPHIGICGDAGAGKDTVADYLCREYGYVKYSLADPIKAGLIAMIDELTWDHFTDRTLKESPLLGLDVSPRQLAQTLGTEWGRDLVDSEIWIDQAHAFMASSSRPVVISDIRFVNEWRAVYGTSVSRCIMVERKVDTVSQHSSEGQLANRSMDCTIDNEGSLEDLYASVDLYITVLLSQYA